MDARANWQTTTLNLEDLSRLDPLAWASFDKCYRRALVGFSQRMGMSEVDSEDVAQAVLVAFADALKDKRFDKSRGKLSSYLFGIARNKILELRRRAGLEHTMPNAVDGASYWESVPATIREVAIWEQTCAKCRMEYCLEILQSTEPVARYSAFELRFRHKKPAAEIAQQVGLTVPQVYKAVNQLRQRLRELLKELADADGSFDGSMPGLPHA